MIYRRCALLAFPLLVALAPLAALAHSHLVSSQPAQAAVLKAAPTSIELKYNEPIRLTAVSIESMDGARQDVTPLPETAQPEFKLPAPTLSPGRHELRWRGMGTDGHVVNGVVRFSIAP